MKIAIVGLGLIGGSFALELQKEHQIYGVDNNKEHQLKAIDLGLVKKTIPLKEINSMDAVIIAVPVDVAPKITCTILDLICKKTLVFDVGSTKEQICNAIKNHPNRANFIATHPIAGTEFSGPQAAIKNLFTNKVNIICEQNKTAKPHHKTFLNLLKPLNMRFVYMDSAKKHDMHIAYVSHLSHISSFMLGKTVLEIEKEEETIFNMAGSGFESTVRLAKSSPKTWTPIFMQNNKHIHKALNEYIHNLQAFKRFLENKNDTAINEEIKISNNIKKILK